MMSWLWKSLFRPRLEPEAMDAYVGRLPDGIDVRWRKEGEYLVGKVSFDNYSFVTQAKKVDEFVNLVNEGVVISNNIPDDYIHALRGFKNYHPGKEGIRELTKAVPGSSGTIKILKKKEKLVHA